MHLSKTAKLAIAGGVAFWLYTRYQTYALNGSGNGTATTFPAIFGF